jgi:hypothetical protein
MKKREKWEEKKERENLDEEGERGAVQHKGIYEEVQ